MNHTNKPRFGPKEIERMKYLLLEEGLRGKEIAQIMGVTASTVNRYLKEIRNATRVPKTSDRAD